MKEEVEVMRSCEGGCPWGGWGRDDSTLMFSWASGS